MLSGFFIFDWVNEQIHRFLLFVDSGIYWLASECYQLFVKLAQTRIFEDNFFSDFAKRIYAILGVFMLFYLAYALLMAIVDPDKLSKGDKSAGRIAANLVISLVLLGFLPSIFNYAYRLQNYILSSNLIGTLVLGTAPIDVNTGTDGDEEVTGREEDTTTIDSSILSYGDVLSFTILNVFLNSDNVNVVVGETDDHQDYTWYDLKADIFEKSNYSALPGMAEAVSTGSTVYGTGQEIVVDYKIIISTAAGIFLVYIMFSFALDLGVRVVKLAFYQLIAPLPVIMRIIPSKKSVFEKWLKQTVSVYLEVFIRVAIMYMAIYFIHGIMANDTLGELWDAGIQGKLALAIVIMGILVFAKQASKMISDLFGIETGGLKLGLGEKLKAGGFFAAGAALGAGATGLARNGIGVLGRAGQRLVGIGTGWSSANGARAKAALIGGGLAGAAGALVGGIPSTFAGGTSGIYHGFMAGKDSKGLGDMVKGAGTGAQKTTDNRERRAMLHRARRLDGPLGGLRGNALAMAKGAASAAATWAGVDDSVRLNSLKEQQAILSDINSKRKAAMDAAEKEMLKKVSLRKATAGNGQTVDGVYYDNLQVLDNMIDTVKTQGRDVRGNRLSPIQQATYLNDLQAVRNKLKDQLTIDYLNGYDVDGVTQDVNKISGQVKEAVVAYHTAIANNVDLVMANLNDVNRSGLATEIQTVNDTVKATKKMNSDELMASYQMANLMEAGKAVAGAAGSNVGVQVNSIMQKQEQDKKK